MAVYLELRVYDGDKLVYTKTMEYNSKARAKLDSIGWDLMTNNRATRYSIETHVDDEYLMY